MKKTILVFVILSFIGKLFSQKNEINNPIKNFEEEDIKCGPPYEFKLEVEFDTDEKIKQFVAVMDTTFISNGFSKPIKLNVTEDTNFQYRISENYGYLRLDEMTEKKTYGKFKHAVDEAIKEFQIKDGVIIDLRFNGGGWDYNSYNLASRFVPKKVDLVHLKRTKY